MNTLGLWSMLRRRSADTKDPQAMTTVLAITAFAVTTAMLLVVIGGFRAFWERAGGRAWMTEGTVGSENFDSQYPVLAGIAILLILVPLVTLGGAAARLAVARRDARLAALRLAGATTTQVTILALLDALYQAVVGALVGIGGYGVLLPLVARLRFQGRTFEIGELWVGIPMVLIAIGVVVIVAAVSSLTSLRRVAVTPLGVATRQTPPGMRAIRVVAFLVVVGAMWAAGQGIFGGGVVGIVILVGILVLGFAMLNLIGPFTIWIVGKMTAGAARKVPTLLAGRRIVDSPKTAWRSVGGVALATFIAGMTSIFAAVDSESASSAADAQFVADMQTGGYLTLAIAGILAAVSTGVMQAGRVIDQRAEYRMLVLAGTDLRTLDRARFRETVIPLTVSVGVSTMAALLYLVPVVGLQGFANGAVVGQFLLCVALAYGLVLVGAAASRGVARSVLATSGSA